MVRRLVTFLTSEWPLLLIIAAIMAMSAGAGAASALCKGMY